MKGNHDRGIGGETGRFDGSARPFMLGGTVTGRKQLALSNPGAAAVTIVMVVEDEPILRMLAREMLEDEGHTVVEFATAAQAMAYCDGSLNTIEAVVTDINMPGDKDGLDLAAHIVATRPGTPVVVTSGRIAALPQDVPSGVTFLPKPWTSDMLVRALKSLQS